VPLKEKDESDPVVLESVSVAFSILGQLSSIRRPLGVTELAQLIGEPKTRVHRFLTSMRQLNVVEQEPAGEKYRLGPHLIALGHAAEAQFQLRDIAAPYLAQLRDVVGQTALLSIPSERSAVVIACEESRGSVCISVKPGTRVSPTASAQGRLTRACLHREEHGDVTSRVLTQADAKDLYTRIAERHHEWSDGEVTSGISAIAFALYDEHRFIGTIGVIGPNSEVPCPPAESLLLEIGSIAAAISRRMGSTRYD